VKCEAVRDFDETQAAVITQEFHRLNTTVVCEKTEGNNVAGGTRLKLFFLGKFVERVMRKTMKTKWQKRKKELRSQYQDTESFLQVY